MLAPVSGISRVVQRKVCPAGVVMVESKPPKSLTTYGPTFVLGGFGPVGTVIKENESIAILTRS